MPFIDVQFLVDRFGAQELVSALNRRLSTRLSASDLEAVADSNPSSNPSDVDGANAVLGWLNQFIEDAHGRVISAIQAQYGTSFEITDPPAYIKRIEADLARYYLYEDHITEVVERRFLDAKEELDEIARGRRKLGVGAISGEQTEPVSSARVVSQETASTTSTGQGITDDEYSKFVG